MILFKVICIILLLCYGVTIIYFLFKWNDIPFFRANCTNYHTTVSIIIAFRNEEKNLDILLDSLIEQDYPSLLYEIILVDDFSKDDSIEVIESKKMNAAKKNINLKIIKAANENKKGAISEGVYAAAGELIITTDADCTMKKNWLKTIVCYYQYFDFDAASAPVAFLQENTFFTKLQKLEFASLVGTGAASVEAGIPVMCNGANLAYKKAAFIQAGGFDGTDKLPSGDDVLLFQKLVKKKKHRIKFIKSEEAIVYTHASTTLKEFINQRRRWASKVTQSFYFPSFAIALIVYLFSLSILITGLASFISSEMFRIFIFLFSVKLFVDFIFFASVLKFFKEKFLLFLILPAEIIYILYVVVVGSMAPFGNYKWKGRSHH